MSMPTLDEQFLPRLVSIFYAVFHPTEGPKVIYQVPEGSITEEEKDKPRKHDSKTSAPDYSTANATQYGGMLGGEPLFDFSALSEYLIPKAPLCGRLVTSIARGSVKTHTRKSRDERAATPSAAMARSRSARSGGRSAGSSRTSSVRPRAEEDTPAQDGKDTQAVLKTYKILGFPTMIEDAARYRRNNFIFNLCFVFDGQADVRAYEPVVRKCGRVLRGLEETQSFLSSPRSLPRMYAIIEQLFEDLNSYCESFVALPEAPHTSYLKSSSKPNSPEHRSTTSPLIGPDDFVSLGASFASLRDEHHKKLINDHLRLMQAQAQHAGPRHLPSSTSSRNQHHHHNSSGGSGDSNSKIAVGGSGNRSRATSETGHGETSLGIGARPSLSPLSTATSKPGSGNEPSMTRSNSATGTSGPAADSPHSPRQDNGPFSPDARRPSLGRSTTVAALTETAPLGASPSAESRDLAMGILSSRKQSELTRELSAAESLGNVLSNRDSGSFDGINTPAGTRRSSRGSGASGHGVGNETSASALEQLTESIVSLRTIDAALSNSVNALRSETIDSTHRAALAEKREPPHGLGRTVRDAINLKLFPVYPNPPPVNDWDVPVALLDLSSRVDGNWDLTMRRILPFIDGVSHVKRIAQLADADLGLTRACLEHLIYYGCIIMVDTFQYLNMYTVRPAIAKMADDEAMGRECAAYVTRPGFAMPSYPELLRLYSLLRAGKTLHDWIEDNDVDAKGIDVRRFVSFGVIQGFLRRVHRYPVYLGGPASEDLESSRFDASANTTVRNSPVSKSNEPYSQMVGSAANRREQSGSREPRDRRPRELSGMSGAYSAFQRIGRDGSVDNPGVGNRTPSRRAASEAGRPMGSVGGHGTPGTGVGGTGSQMTDSTHLGGGGSGAGGSAFGTSPTKRGNRHRPRATYRLPTATAMDVASVAFEVSASDSRWSSGHQQAPTPGFGIARSPRKRSSMAGLSGVAGATGSGFLSTASGPGAAGASGISQRSNPVVVPPGLIDMLDGTHHDDELCVMFSVSWSELEKMLIQIGTAKDGLGMRLIGAGADSEEETSTAQHRSADWRRWHSSVQAGQSQGGGAAGASSGWNKGRMSGFSGVGASAGVGQGGGTIGRSGLSGVASSSNRTGGTQTDSGILLNNPGASGFGIGYGWGVDPDESGVAGWSSFSGLDRQAIESGDLGRVRILLQ